VLREPGVAGLPVHHRLVVRAGRSIFHQLGRKGDGPMTAQNDPRPASPVGGEAELEAEVSTAALADALVEVAKMIAAPGTKSIIERSAKRLRALSAPSVTGEAVAPDTGREAIWKVVHEVWRLLDEAETDGMTGITTPDQERWNAVSEAMDELEALVPESEGPFWGGFPVNYLWPKEAGQ
jgi:hypothetical protein